MKDIKGIKLIIKHGCPNCRGEIESDRIVCTRCSPAFVSRENICSVLINNNKIKDLKIFCRSERNIRDFEQFFLSATGQHLWSVQRQWARLYFLEKSFGLNAPTGVGKTTFGLVLSLFISSIEDKRSILVFPTRLLANQAEERLNQFCKRLGTSKIIYNYRSTEGSKEIILEKKFDILICTNMFLQKNYELISSTGFELLFIDDIDSFLKSTKNTIKILKLLDFTEREINTALKASKTEEDYEFLKNIRNVNRRKRVVISSATIKPRRSVENLFRNLLGFSIQRAVPNIRNILDTVEEAKDFYDALEKSIKLIKKLGKGGLIFLPITYGKGEVQEVINRYKEAGIKAITYDSYDSNKRKNVEDLYKTIKEGNFDVAVGISHPLNPLVRGIDIPHTLRYVLFLGVPVHRFPLKIEQQPRFLHHIITSLYEIFNEHEKSEASKHLNYLKKHLYITDISLIKSEKVKERILLITRWLENHLKDRNFISRIDESPDIEIEFTEKEPYITIADTTSYIQATGRVSRLVGGRLIKGLSILIYWDKKQFTSLKKRLTVSYFNQDIEFKDINSVNLDEVLKEIDRDRETPEKKERPDSTDVDSIKTTLVIVESPNKARTISNFYGKPQIILEGETAGYLIPCKNRVLIITASLGHLLDLVVDTGFFGVSADDGFVPVYDTIKTCTNPPIQHTEIEYLKKRCKNTGKIKDKQSIVEGLRFLSYLVDEVFIATDPDSEGEKIAFDIHTLIKAFSEKIYRAEFHEIRPAAFEKALGKAEETGGKIDTGRVQAQIVRRVLDRWVGFTLSRILWDNFGENWHSAGRVQTPVLGWIIERENQLRQKKPLLFLKIGNYEIRIPLEKVSPRSISIDKPELISIDISEMKDKAISEYNPLPPFSTDTVLTEAYRIFRFPAKKTMGILQNLFESGLITYHRTDSTRVSEAGIYSVAAPYIAEKYGRDYFRPREWEKGGAHECIRPTKAVDAGGIKQLILNGTLEVDNPKDLLKLYDLIFRRFIASQMRETLIKKELLTLKFPGFTHHEVVNTEVVQDGFNLVYNYLKIFDRERMNISEIKLIKAPSNPPYNQGTLIEEMKNRKLGRPSTYSHIIQTLIDRGYIVDRKGWLHPTKKGKKVYEFLKNRYKNYTSEDFTRRLEQSMDMIEKGLADWQNVLSDSYKIRELLNSTV